MHKKCLSCEKPHLDIGDDGLCTECSYDQYISNKEVSKIYIFLKLIFCPIAVIFWLIAVRIPSLILELISEWYNRLLVKISNSPKAYSKVKSSWANEALSNLPTKKQFDILDKMEITSAWRFLRTKPMPIMVDLLKMMQEEKARNMLMLESLTHRKRIAAQVGLDLGEIKDKEDIIPNTPKQLKPYPSKQQKPFRETIPVTEAKMKERSCISHSEEDASVEQSRENTINPSTPNEDGTANEISETRITTDSTSEKQSNEVLYRDSIIKCSNCDEAIGKLEITCKFKDYTVCNKCYKKLNTQYELEG